MRLFHTVSVIAKGNFPDTQKLRLMLNLYCFSFRILLTTAILTELAHANTFFTNKPFDLTININGSYQADKNFIIGSTKTSGVRFSSSNQIFSAIFDENLKSINLIYTEDSAALIRFGHRDLPSLAKTKDSLNFELQHQ